MSYTAIIEKMPDGLYIASCAEVRGANTQGFTLDEATSNLAEAIQLVLGTEKEIAFKQARKRRSFYRKVSVV